MADHAAKRPRTGTEDYYEDTTSNYSISGIENIEEGGTPFTFVSYKKDRPSGIPILIKPTNAGSSFWRVNPNAIASEILAVSQEKLIAHRFTKDGSLAVNVASLASANKLLAITTLVGVTCTATVPKSYSRNIGKITGVPLEYTEEELLEFLKDFGVLSLRRQASYYRREDDDSTDTIYHDSVILHFRPDKPLPTRVHPLYQSKTCGLCGNYDNEPAFEFFTPTNELVSNYSEFVASYGFGGAQCHEVVPSVLSTLSQLQVLKGAFLATWAARPAHLGRSWFNVMGHHQHHHHELPEENSDEVKDGVLPWFHPEHLLPHHKYPQHHKTTPYPYATPFTPRYHHHSTQYHYATPFTPRHYEHSKHHHYATPEYYESEEYRRATPFTPRHYGSTKYNYAATPFTPRHYESEEELRATPFTPRYHHYKATPFTPRYHHQAKKFTPLYYESEEDLRATPFTPRYHHYKATPFTPRYHHATPFTPRHYESEEELGATPFTPRYHHYKATPFTPRYHHATPFTPRHYESEEELEELGATPFTPRYHHYKATPFTPRYHRATPFTPRHYESDEELGATPFTPRYHHSTPYPYATPFTPRHHHTKEHHYATPYTPRYPSEDLQRSEILEELKSGQMMKQYYEDTEESKCFQERTIMRDHEGMICYSQVPVPSCKPGCKKGKGSVQLSVPFVCLDRSSPMAKELTKKVRKLGNVGKLPIDLETTPHVEQVRVPEKSERHPDVPLSTPRGLDTDVAALTRPPKSPNPENSKTLEMMQSVQLMSHLLVKNAKGKKI
ncbi:hypothetical protein ISCGN_027843 [Ixodes scapularis]